MAWARNEGDDSLFHSKLMYLFYNSCDHRLPWSLLILLYRLFGLTSFLVLVAFTNSWTGNFARPNLSVGLHGMGPSFTCSKVV